MELIKVFSYSVAATMADWQYPLPYRSLSVSWVPLLIAHLSTYAIGVLFKKLSVVQMHSRPFLTFYFIRSIVSGFVSLINLGLVLYRIINTDLFAFFYMQTLNLRPYVLFFFSGLEKVLCRLKKEKPGPKTSQVLLMDKEIGDVSINKARLFLAPTWDILRLAPVINCVFSTPTWIHDRPQLLLL